MSQIEAYVSDACAVAILLWLAALAVRLAAGWWLARSHSRQQHCGHCGYIIVAGSAKRCPDCGRDTRASGLFSERPFLRLSAIDFAVLAGLLMTPAAIDAAHLLARHEPAGWYFQANEYIETQETQFHVQAFGHGRYFRKTPDTIRVLVADTNGSVNRTVGLTITVRTWSVDTWNGAGQTRYDAATTTKLISKAVKLPAARIVELAAELDRAIHKLGRGEFSSEPEWDKGRQKVSYATEPNMLLLAVIICLCATWLAAYLLGRIAMGLILLQRAPWWVRDAKYKALAAPPFPEPVSTINRWVAAAVLSLRRAVARILCRWKNYGVV